MQETSILNCYNNFDDILNGSRTSLTAVEDVVNGDQFPTALISREAATGETLFFQAKESAKGKGLSEWLERASFAPASSSWYYMAAGLRHQTRVMLGDSYLGYSMFSLRKKLNSDADFEKAPYASMIFDCPAYIFDEAGTPSKYWVNTSMSDDVKFPTAYYLEKDQGLIYAQHVIRWGGDNGELVLDLREVENAEVPRRRVIASVRKSKESVDEKFVNALSFMVTNALQSYCDGKPGVSLGDVIAHPGGMLYSHINSLHGLTAALISFWIEIDTPINVDKILRQHITLLRSWSVPFERHFFSEKGIRENERLKLAHTQSAIAAIMSRNGSHNIGSHVLSALTHNVGTMPDDRVLYQYIQHRMDYIATATTGFPDWGVPTMFVGEIMRNFMIQHHLLDHIVESEGLHAYHFQGHNASAAVNSTDALRIKIVATNKDGSIRRDFVLYDGEQDASKSIFPRNGFHLNDVSVSIPGGVAGHHAIYTILENVIRNAAKHGWAKSARRKHANLEVTVAFTDDPGNGCVWVVVHDNMPLPSSNGDHLVANLNAKLKEKLISEDANGELRKENWGLAEMRISAAYLQQRSLAETGGLSNLKKGDRIITAEVVEGPNDEKYLGYRFFIRKPLEMLLTVPHEWTDAIAHLKDNEGAAARLLALAGVDVAVQNEKGECIDIVTGEKRNNLRYAFAVFPRQPEQLRDGAYPFRLLVLGGDGELVWNPRYKEDGTYNGRERTPIGSMMLPSLAFQSDKIRELLCNVGAHCDTKEGNGTSDGVDGSVSEVRNIIYNTWIQYLDKRTRTLTKDYKKRLCDSGQHTFGIYVDTDGEESNSGCELLSDRDVWGYLLEHSYGTILGMARKIVDRNVDAQEIDKDKKRENRSQVETLFVALGAVSTGKDLLDCGISLEKDSDRVCSASQITDQVLRQIKSEEVVNDLDARGLGVRESLCKCLLGAFSATDAMLRKYAERIDTLPEKFCEATANQDANGTAGRKNLLNDVTLLSKADIDDDKTTTNCTISYLRHAGDAVRDIYASGLSGSQSCFSQFKSFEMEHNELSKQSMLVRLVENALLRVLIIDERVCKFLSSRPRLVGKLSRMNVWAVNTDMGQCAALNREDVSHETPSCLAINWDAWKQINTRQMDGENDKDDGLLPSSQFDVLVIHQGIIDKILGDQCTKEQVEAMLERLKKVVPYVVITTGRGRPTNTPSSARILPFSCVERYLFQEWPEKFLLVNSIMSLLPCGD